MRWDRTRDQARQVRLPGAGPARGWLRGFLGAGSAMLLAAATMLPAAGSPDDDQPASDGDAELLLVMDASASMTELDSGGAERIEAAREALHAVVDDLDDDLDAGLRVFSSDITDGEDDAACTDSRLAVEIGDDNRDELREAIDDYDAVGARTPIAHALEEAAQDLGDEGKRTIVLVSDGQENCVPDPCQAAEAIADEGLDVAVHTVGYNVNDDAHDQLQCISNTTNGNYYDAEDVESLTQTLQRLSLRAHQPFQLEGESVTGSQDVETAPTLEPGQYVDHWGDEPSFYRIPVSEGASSVHVGVSAIHLDEANADPLAFGIGTEDTDTWTTYPGTSYSTNTSLCAQSNVYEGAFGSAQTVRSNQVTVNRTADPGRAEGCDTADELILMVEAPERGDGNSYVGQPFEFVVEEEAEVTNLDDLPERAGGSISEYQWQDMDAADAADAEELLGGNPFNNAEPVEPGGTYTSEIMPGELLIYRVPVDWGESVQAELAVGPGTEWAPEGDRGRDMRVQFYSPNRGQVENSSNADGQEHRYYGGTSHSDTTYRQNVSHPVRWKSREDAPGHRGMSHASVAGDYYVLVSQGEVRDRQAAPVPFTLAVDTFGEVEGEPVYAEAAATEGDAGTDSAEDADTDDTGAAAEDTDSGLQPMHWVGIGLVGVLLLAGAAVAVIRTSRK